MVGQPATSGEPLYYQTLERKTSALFYTLLLGLMMSVLGMDYC